MKRTGYRFIDPSALARIQNLALAARGVVEGFISGMHASPFRGYSVEFAEHRNYVRGDSLRHLDWRMFARTDRLYVKQYEEETNLRAQIVLDSSSSMLYRSGDALTKFEYGAYLTASLALLMTRQQDAVGLTTFAEGVQLDMPARTSPRHFGEMMRQLEGVADQLRSARGAQLGRQTRIADTLHRLAQRFKRRRLIVLISDLYDDVEPVLRALHHFRHCRHELIVFHVLDRTELEFPFRQTVRFRDMETGQRLQVDPTFVREEYQRELQAFLDRFRRGCRESQIDYVLANTATPYDHLLARYLMRRSGL